MPELPEVENVKRSLEPVLLGKKIRQVVVTNPVVIKYNPLEEFVDVVKDSVIMHIQRRGKFLLFDLENSLYGLQDLIVHLGMTGALIHSPNGDEGIEAFPDYIKNHIFVKFYLKGGSLLFYSDYRRFGSLRVIDDHTLNYGDYQQPGLTHLKTLREMGPEPLDKDSVHEFISRIRHKRYANRAIKEVLLDQQVVAGVGNIYASEVCHSTRFHPLTTVSELGDKELEEIFESLRLILLHSIESGGTSIKDYVDGAGKSGGYQEHLKVYNQTVCGTCGGYVTKIMHKGRSTFYCHECQPQKW